MANEIIYVRDGARFIQDGEPGEGLSSIEGFLTGVAEVSGNQARPYIAHFLPLRNFPGGFRYFPYGSRSAYSLFVLRRRSRRSGI